MHLAGIVDIFKQTFDISGMDFGDLPVFQDQTYHRVGIDDLFQRFSVGGVTGFGLFAGGFQLEFLKKQRIELFGRIDIEFSARGGIDLRALIFIAALRAAHYCPSFMSEEDGYFIKRLFIWLEFFWPWH